MTCIVGIETKKGVLIGGDSASSVGWETSRSRIKKVFRNGDFLIGYTTSFRMGQLLQYQLSIDGQNQSQKDLEYLSTIFIDAVRKCLDAGGFKTIENNQESGGEFLVGYKKKLYVVHSDFQVNSSVDGYFAIGCGANFAMGNIYSSKNLAPKKRIKQALKAAAHFSNGVCKPFHIMKM